MLVALLIPLFGFFYFGLGIRPFSGTLISILIFPLIAIPLIGISPVGLIGIVPAVLVSAVLVAAIVSRLPLGAPDSKDGLYELLLVPILYLPLRALVARWPEFYNLGEHIRDFAVLSAVTRDPVRPLDPWCDSLVLNYYVYWFRYAALLTRLFSFTTAETYHFFIAIIPAALFAILTRLGRVIAKWSWLSALCAAALITFGSNIAGFVSIVRHEFWWGPSRAVSIGITEFPAWSFLLGDLHPHYLSLVLVPAFLLIALEIKPLSATAQLFLAPLYFLSCASLVAAANTWDVFGLILLAAPFFVSLAVSTLAPAGKKSSAGSWSRSETILVAALCLCVSMLALLSNAHMQPAPIELKLVPAAGPHTKASEYLSHWGFPLALIVLSLVILRRRFFRARASVLITVGSLLILLFTEIFFFDDPYGGEFERLNTIFKFFSFVWVPLHFGAFLVFSEALETLPPALVVSSTRLPVLFCALVLSTAFFFSTAFSPSGRTVYLSKYVEPRGEGLSKLEEDSPGAAAAIRALRKLPSGTRVMEWNEPAYSNAANLCSLSEHACYAGWRNHLSIQYAKGLDELSRREEIIRTMYGPLSCEKKYALARSEGIGAVVVGPNERAAFKRLRTDTFACFHLLVSGSASGSVSDSASGSASAGVFSVFSL